MLGLVLEGGGAKGSFQAGLLRALLDNGYKFDGAVGTSIGALNAAMLVQGDFEKSYEIWENMEFSQLFDFQDIYAENLAKKNFDSETVRYLLVKLKEAIKNRGLDTTKIRMLMDYYVDEERLRASKMDFGLMTVRLFEDGSVFKPCPVFKEDIPCGSVASYIMASANFPGFPAHYIDNKSYRDGGLYDNLPVNMLIDRGYTDIIAVHLIGWAAKQKPKESDVNIRYIIPSEKPGRVLDFNNGAVNRGILMGYLDGMRFVKGYIGTMYYVEDIRDYSVLYDRILAFPEEFYADIARAVDVHYYGGKEKCLYDVCARLRHIMDIKDMLSVAELFEELIERYALEYGVDRLRIYSMADLVSATYNAYSKGENSRRGTRSRKKTQLDNAFLIFTKYYK